MLSAALGSVESHGDTLAKLLALIDSCNPALASKASIESPLFLGYPRAPTLPADDSSDGLATTANVAARFNALLNGAPRARYAERIGRGDRRRRQLRGNGNGGARNRLRVDAAQGLSSGRKGQARANLGSGAIGDSVFTSPDAATTVATLGFVQSFWRERLHEVS